MAGGAADRIFARILHPEARGVRGGSPAGAVDWNAHRFLLLVTFRQSGAGVPTPVWFAPAQQTLYFSTDAASGKVKRLRRDPRVVICPCDARGKPRGAEVQAQARVLEGSEAAVAERALAARYGSLRRVYRRLFPQRAPAYLALEPD